MAPLHTYVFGPPDGTPVVALHGLTGHGRRWEHFCETRIPGLRVIAPDLLGHGRSPWRPPWGIDDHVEAVADVVAMHLGDAVRFVLVGHSFGGAIATRLAVGMPDRIRRLVLLDPAQGLNPVFALEAATDTLDNWDYANAGAARATKLAEGWSEVPADDLDRELEEHLVERPHGRVGWRISEPATATAWGELARPFVLPPAGVDTHLVVADRVDPPFVTKAFVDACTTQRDGDVAVHHVDCGHMVPFLEPDLCARLITDGA
ncbi:alpha/beta hydrolase [Gordonia otitidis]|uniref:Hydrolase n=1 Tax=Gordonia otitidis (strain DSM 44809 / CCUG 52243 / JCM 12355 / NBRC 100426 / IFM 10032) TaxID=1108044 RepID=H5TQH7_GORO1|nr:alpha/beta fold hydrolase [Gordonia otitidis]GAB35735.1 putative hydrolase [Gordonia otitidis NBRC 100426]